jgi:hypothetical protein
MRLAPAFVFLAGFAACGSEDDEARTSCEWCSQCNICNAVSFVCSRPGFESQTLTLQGVAEAGCRGKLAANEVEIRCETSELCTTGEGCQPISAVDEGFTTAVGICAAHRPP